MLVLAIHCTMVNILHNFLWGVSHSTEWSEKKNPVEDNLLKNNYCAAFRLKKIPALLVRWEKRILPLKNIPTPLRPPLKSQMARPLLFFLVHFFLTACHTCSKIICLSTNHIADLWRFLSSLLFNNNNNKRALKINRTEL